MPTFRDTLEFAGFALAMILVALVIVATLSAGRL